MDQAALNVLILGTILFCAGLPLFLRAVPRNLWYGFRHPRTLADDTTWYPANRRVGGGLTLVGVVAVMIALLLPARIAQWLGLAVLLIGVVAVTVDGVVWLRKRD